MSDPRMGFVMQLLNTSSMAGIVVCSMPLASNIYHVFCCRAWVTKSTRSVTIQ